MSDNRSTFEKDYADIRDAYLFSLLPTWLQYVLWVVVVLFGMGLVKLMLIGADASFLDLLSWIWNEMIFKLFKFIFGVIFALFGINIL